MIKHTNAETALSCPGIDDGIAAHGAGHLRRRAAGQSGIEYVDSGVQKRLARHAIGSNLVAIDIEIDVTVQRRGHVNAQVALIASAGAGDDRVCQNADRQAAAVTGVAIDRIGAIALESTVAHGRSHHC